MHLFAFTTWLLMLSVVKAAYNPTLFAFSANQSLSTVLLNTGDGQVIGLDASLTGNSYIVSTPNIADGPLSTSIAPALCNYLWIHTYITDPDGRVWRRTYGAGKYAWMDEWLGSEQTGLSNLASSQGPVDTSSVYTATKSSGEVCFSLSSSTRYAPSQCQRFNGPFITPFSSKVSQISTQTTDSRLSLVVHYVGLSSTGGLLYNKQWYKNDGTNYLTQTKLAESLRFVGEPLITRKSHTELDVWAISDTARLYRRSYTGTVSSGSWNDWEDLGQYNSLTKPAVAYDAANTTYIMGLNPDDRHKYLFKSHSPETGWYPGPDKTAWIPSLYTNWLTPPTMSVYNDGTTRGSDVHVWGINKNGKLYYSYLRDGKWRPNPQWYYEIMDVPGIVASGGPGIDEKIQKVFDQNELR